MSSSSEPMIFPVTALYLFVSREEREGGSSFTRKGQVVLDRGPMANTDTIEDIKLIKDLPHKFYPVGEKKQSRFSRINAVLYRA